MDYLIFASGIFLAVSGVACMLVPKSSTGGGAWMAGATSFLALAAACWLDLLAFALDADSVMGVLVAALVGLSSGMMACFFLRTAGVPSVFGNIVALAAGVAAGWFAWSPSLYPLAAGFGALVGAGFGWSIGRAAWPASKWGQSASKWLPALAGALVVGTLSWPLLVENVHDTAAEGYALARLGILALLMLATMASAGTAAFLWFLLNAPSNRAMDPKAAVRMVMAKVRNVAAALVFLVVLGGFLSHWVGVEVEKSRAQQLLDIVKIGATALDGDALATMSADESALQDPDYSHVQRRLRDLRASLPGCRFIYTAGLRGRNFVYLVDSEALQSPGYCPPGKDIQDEPAKWVGARDGNSYFGGPRRDIRGAWYTALLPVWDSSRNSTSIIGVDYPVREWLRPVVMQRLVVMWGVLAGSTLLLGFAVHRHLASGQDARFARVSSRLSHAMEAAEFDSIDWYPEENRIVLGDRLALKLGFPADASGISMRSFWKRVHPQDRSLLAFRLRHLAAGAEPSDESEVRLLDRNSNPLWFLLHGRLMTTPGDGSPHVSAMALNVHETKRSRQELERQKLFARQVMNAVPGGVAILDGSGTIKFVNRAYSRMAMMAEAFLVGIPYQRTLDIGPTVGPDMARFEAGMKRGDGSTLPVRVFRSPYAESGQEMGSILAVTDLSALRDAEKALLNLRGEAKRLSLVAAKMEDAVIFTDPQGRINWVNAGFTRLTGYSRAEVTGRKPGSFLQRADADPEVRKFMRECIASGQGFETEVLNHTKEGAPYLAHINCHPILDDTGTLTGFMAIQRDITREREKEKFPPDPVGKQGSSGSPPEA